MSSGLERLSRQELLAVVAVQAQMLEKLGVYRAQQSHVVVLAQPFGLTLTAVVDVQAVEQAGAQPRGGWRSTRPSMPDLSLCR